MNKNLEQKRRQTYDSLQKELAQLVNFKKGQDEKNFLKALGKIYNECIIFQLNTKEIFAYIYNMQKILKMTIKEEFFESSIFVSYLICKEFNNHLNQNTQSHQTFDTNTDINQIYQDKNNEIAILITNCHALLWNKVLVYQNEAINVIMKDKFLVHKGKYIVEYIILCLYCFKQKTLDDEEWSIYTETITKKLIWFFKLCLKITNLYLCDINSCIKDDKNTFYENIDISDLYEYSFYNGENLLRLHYGDTTNCLYYIYVLKFCFYITKGQEISSNIRSFYELLSRNNSSDDFDNYKIENHKIDKNISDTSRLVKNILLFINDGEDCQCLFKLEDNSVSQLIESRDQLAIMKSSSINAHLYENQSNVHFKIDHKIDIPRFDTGNVILKIWLKNFEAMANIYYNMGIVLGRIWTKLKRESDEFLKNYNAQNNVSLKAIDFLQNAFQILQHSLNIYQIVLLIKMKHKDVNNIQDDINSFNDKFILLIKLSEDIIDKQEICKIVGQALLNILFFSLPAKENCDKYCSYNICDDYKIEMNICKFPSEILSQFKPIIDLYSSFINNIFLAEDSREPYKFLKCLDTIIKAGFCFVRINDGSINKNTDHLESYIHKLRIEYMLGKEIKNYFQRTRPYKFNLNILPLASCQIMDMEVSCNILIISKKFRFYLNNSPQPFPSSNHFCFGSYPSTYVISDYSMYDLFDTLIIESSQCGSDQDELVKYKLFGLVEKGWILMTKPKKGSSFDHGSFEDVMKEIGTVNISDSLQDPMTKDTMASLHLLKFSIKYMDRTDNVVPIALSKCVYDATNDKVIGASYVKEELLTFCQAFNQKSFDQFTLELQKSLSLWEDWMTSTPDVTTNIQGGGAPVDLHEVARIRYFRIKLLAIFFKIHSLDKNYLCTLNLLIRYIQKFGGMKDFEGSPGSEENTTSGYPYAKQYLHEYLWVLVSICERYLSFGYLQQANIILSQANKISDALGCNKDNQWSNLSLKILNANYQAESGQILEGWKIANEIEGDVALGKKYIQSYVTKLKLLALKQALLSKVSLLDSYKVEWGTNSLLLAKERISLALNIFKIFCPTFGSKGGSGNKVTEPKDDTTLKFICFETGLENNQNFDLIFKLECLDMLMQSMYSFAEACHLRGLVREARCYLLESINLCQRYYVPLGLARSLSNLTLFEAYAGSVVNCLTYATLSMLTNMSPLFLESSHTDITSLNDDIPRTKNSPTTASHSVETFLTKQFIQDTPEATSHATNVTRKVNTLIVVLQHYCGMYPQTNPRFDYKWAADLYLTLATLNTPCPGTGPAIFSESSDGQDSFKLFTIICQLYQNSMACYVADVNRVASHCARSVEGLSSVIPGLVVERREPPKSKSNAIAPTSPVYPSRITKFWHLGLIDLLSYRSRKWDGGSADQRDSLLDGVVVKSPFASHLQEAGGDGVDWPTINGSGGKKLEVDCYELYVTLESVKVLLLLKSALERSNLHPGNQASSQRSQRRPLANACRGEGKTFVELSVPRDIDGTLRGEGRDDRTIGHGKTIPKPASKKGPLSMSSQDKTAKNVKVSGSGCVSDTRGESTKLRREDPNKGSARSTANLIASTPACPIPLKRGESGNDMDLSTDFPNKGHFRQRLKSYGRFGGLDGLHTILSSLLRTHSLMQNDPIYPVYGQVCKLLSFLLLSHPPTPHHLSRDDHMVRRPVKSSQERQNGNHKRGVIKKINDGTNTVGGDGISEARAPYDNISAYVLSHGFNSAYQQYSKLVERKRRKSGTSQTNEGHIYREIIKGTEEHLKNCEHEFRSLSSLYPPNWTFCFISTLHYPCELNHLRLTRLENGNSNSSNVLIPFTANEQDELLSKFTQILTENKGSSAITASKTLWWKERRNLDAKLENLLEHMEKDLLGRWKCLLTGTVQDDVALSITLQKRDCVTKVGRDLGLQFDENLLQSVITSFYYDSIVDSDSTYLIDGILECIIEEEQTLTQISKSKLVKRLKECLDLKRQANPLDVTTQRKGPVILIIEPVLACLPWESMACLRYEQVYRLPCLLSPLSDPAGSQLVKEIDLDTSQSYYIINPGGDLAETQKIFEPWFRELGWKGISGLPPTPHQFIGAISDHDLFVYCGHGSGNAYISKDDINEIRGKAVSFLVGCSTGYLTDNGKFEPFGIVLNYLLAGCPAIMANLWDVTSQDIDRYLKYLLETWFNDPTITMGSILQSSRNVCKLVNMVGASPIVYGYPCKLKHTPITRNL